MQVIQKPEHSSIEWQRLRHRDENGKVRFGASEAASLMNASVYDTRSDLITRKMNEAETSDPSPAMYSGNLFEPVLLDEASRRLGMKIITPDFMFARDRFIATPDGIDDLSISSPSVWVEAKCTSRYRVKNFDDIPEMWRWQMAAQSYCIDGSAEMYLIVLDADLHINLINVPRNLHAEQQLAEMAETVGRWIDDRMIPDSEIERMNAKQIQSLWTASENEVDLPTEAAEWLMTLDEAKGLIKQGEDLKSRAETWFAQHLLDASVGKINGEVAITWKEQAGRASIDSKRLAEDHPDLVEQYRTQGKPFRVLRVSKRKAK